MLNTHLLRGVAFGALTLNLSSVAAAAPTHRTLPTIDIAAANRSAAPSRSTGPATPSRGPARSSNVVAPSAPVASAPSIWSPTLPDGKPAFVQRWQLPNTVASVTRRDIQDKINIIDTEDAVKYMPSLFVRKRNNGDTQAVLQTRDYGVSSSARSLIYADDLLLSALIGNDNGTAGPRWGLVAPEEIERIDFLYGPFAAQYPGNSIGGVMKITTRMPEKLEMTAKQTQALQDFSLYGTSKLFHSEVTAATMGDKVGDFSWFFAGNYAHNTTQPVQFTTMSNIYGWPGAYFATNKMGFPATVIGTGGNLDQDQVNLKVKLAYDITPTTRATYTVGFWSSDGTSIPENYLVSGYGPFFGRLTGPGNISSALQTIGGAYYRHREQMLTNAAAIRSNTGGVFDYELSASHFTYLQNDQRTAYSGASPAGWTQTGRNPIMTGTYWTLLDLNGIVRPEGYLKGHDISFGLHGDQVHLNHNIWLTSDWTAGQATALVPISLAQGTTRTQALWAQDAWKFNDNFKFTVGIRGEHWIASDGINQATAGINATGTSWSSNPALSRTVWQPVHVHTRFSPKGSLQWTPDENWTVVGSIGIANRFPTPRELYSLTTPSGTNNNTITNPNPNLRPEVSLSKELAITRQFGSSGWGRLSFWDDEVRDAIISQQAIVPGTTFLTQSNQNIDRVRYSGIELAWQKNDVLLKGLEFGGSVTYLNARIISNPTWAPTSLAPLGANLDWWAWRVDGKNPPQIPKWRWTATATYRPDDNWAFTLAARWQDRMWTTMANNDVAHNVWQSFDRFFVVDVKARYKYNERLSFDFGIDNINNYKYMLFHPFPQRTFYLSGKYEFGTDKKGAPGIFFTGNEAGLPDLATWFQPASFSIN